jgi:hypothetical protein
VKSVVKIPHSPQCRDSGAEAEILRKATGFLRQEPILVAFSQPGTQASFKVFVILDTGNEAGSAAMTVERPL